MTFKKFGVNDKGTFKYIFYHWLAYNYTAWKLGVWKPKWLLHDVEKPFLMLLWNNDYMRVRTWHKHHNKHHVLYGHRNGLNKVDWLAAVIDWECGHLTKNQCPRNGRQEVDYLVSDKSKYSADEKEEIRKNCYPILDYLGL